MERTLGPTTARDFGTALPPGTGVLPSVWSLPSQTLSAWGPARRAALVAGRAPVQSRHGSVVYKTFPPRLGCIYIFMCICNLTTANIRHHL